MSSRKTSSHTAEQLRHDIDSGCTGDKVRGSDPAAVPLGTDEEATGTAVPAEAIAHARQVERRQGMAQRASAGAEDARRQSWTLTAALALAAIVLIAVGIAP